LGMDRIINYLLLVIIFVFDPLAISLVIAANFMFSLNSKDKETNDFEEEKTIIEKEIIEPNEELIKAKERHDKEVESKVYEVENVEGDVTLHSKKESIITEEEEEEEQPIIDDTDIVEPVTIEKQKNNKRLVYKKRDDSN